MRSCTRSPRNRDTLTPRCAALWRSHMAILSSSVTVMFFTATPREKCDVGNYIHEHRVIKAGNKSLRAGRGPEAGVRGSLPPFIKIYERGQAYPSPQHSSPRTDADRLLV